MANPSSSLIPPGWSPPLLDASAHHWLNVAALPAMLLGAAVFVWTRTIGESALGFISLLMSLFAFSYAAPLLRVRFIVCPEGIVFIRLWGPYSCTWDDIKGLRTSGIDTAVNGHGVGRDYDLGVECRYGRKFTIQQVHPEVIRLIQEEYYRWQLPRVLELWSSGQMVSFGSLKLSVAGIHSGTDLLPWSNVKQIVPIDGNLAITAKDRWKTWRTVKMPYNTLLFQKLVSENIAAGGTVAGP